MPKNLISDQGAICISEFLLFSGSSLKLLNLHWNKISYIGGNKIAEALIKNDTLRIIDLSWNLIGKPTINKPVQLANIIKYPQPD